MQLEGNTLNCYHFVNSLIEVNVSIGLLNMVISMLLSVESELLDFIH